MKDKLLDILIKVSELRMDVETAEKKITKLLVKDKSTAQNFADTIRDDPKAIIGWCRREIIEYEKLIKILEGKP